MVMPPEWDFTEYSYKPFQNLLALHRLRSFTSFRITEKTGLEMAVSKAYYRSRG
jgi:hypothetical protein